MRRRVAILLTALCAAVPTFFVLQPAHSAGQLCYDVQIQIADQPPQGGADCVVLPALP